jgi:hypothetical protein
MILTMAHCYINPIQYYFFGLGVNVGVWVLDRLQRVPTPHYYLQQSSEHRQGVRPQLRPMAALRRRRRAVTGTRPLNGGQRTASKIPTPSAA